MRIAPRTVFFALSGLACAGVVGQECISDKYTEWTIDSLVDPVMREEVLSFYPAGLLYDSSSAELIVIPGRANCDDRVEFTGNGVSVVIEGRPFDPTKHTLGYDRGGHPALLCTIDGQGIWGTDGDLPRNEIVSLSVELQGRRVTVPEQAVAKLYEPNFCDSYPRSPDAPSGLFAGCRSSKDRRRLYVHMLNSDGAGGYLVTWVFQDGRYWGRVVEHGF